MDIARGLPVCFRRGEIVKGRFVDGQWYLAEVMHDNGNGTYRVAWLDGDTSDCIKSSSELKLMRYHESLQCYQEVSSTEEVNDTRSHEEHGVEVRSKERSRWLDCQGRGHHTDQRQQQNEEDWDKMEEHADRGCPHASLTPVVNEERGFDGHALLHLDHCKSFQEALELKFRLTVNGRADVGNRARVERLVADVALDPEPQDKSWPPCLRGAVVQKVDVRADGDARFRVHNLPSDRPFLVALVAHLRAGGALRSEWLRCRTLPEPPAPEGGADGFDDFYSLTRGGCLGCLCDSFELLGGPLREERGAAAAPCRRCGCPAASHALVRESVVVTPGGGSSGSRARCELRLPPEAGAWDQRELGLFLSSRGQFRPDAMAARRRPAAPAAAGPRASVVSPTTESRQALHAQLWAVFEAQDWPEKELVVVETFAERPSPFLAEKAREDERLVYLPLRVQRGDDLYVGLKRNMCTHLASGEYIVNFDDDDLYAPCYIDTMLSAMWEQQCEAITLSSWFVFEASTGKVGHVDPKAALEEGLCDPELADHWVFGYGFSYVFSRELALSLRFPHCDFGEDYEFMKYVRLRHLREAAAEPQLDCEGERACREGEEGRADVDASTAWVEETDEATCAQLYRNRVTGEVRWDKPAEFVPQREHVRGARDRDRAETAGSALGLQFLESAGVALYHDTAGICLHTLHAKSTSGKDEDLETSRMTARCEVQEEEVEALEFAQLAGVFRAYLGLFPRTGRASKFVRPAHAASGAQGAGRSKGAARG